MTNIGAYLGPLFNGLPHEEGSGLNEKDFNATFTQLRETILKYILEGPVGVVVMKDTALRQRLVAHNYPVCRTFSEGLEAAKLHTSGLIYVVTYEAIDEITIDLKDFPTNLKICGFISGIQPMSIFCGGITIKDASQKNNIGGERRLQLEDLVIFSDKKKPVVTVFNPAVLEVHNVKLLRENTFSHELVKGEVVNPAGFEEVVTPPGSLTQFAHMTLAGAAMGAAIYGVWLGVLLFIAGGSVAVGPATLIFGPMALGWSGTLGATVFSTILGSATYPAYMLSHWLRDKVL